MIGLRVIDVFVFYVPVVEFDESFHPFIREEFWRFDGFYLFVILMIWGLPDIEGIDVEIVFWVVAIEEFLMVILALLLDVVYVDIGYVPGGIHGNVFHIEE